jgi:hypothetical protein
MLGCCCWLQLGLLNWVNYLVDLTGWLVRVVLQRNLKMVQRGWISMVRLLFTIVHCVLFTALFTIHCVVHCFLLISLSQSQWIQILLRRS